LDAPTKEEIMVTAGARALKDYDLVVVGVGLPQVAAILARKTHAPNLNMVLEIGIINPGIRQSSWGAHWTSSARFCREA
jgi:glutaconate CoA-transferase, subunit B